MIFIATLKGLTERGEGALRRSIHPSMNRVVRQGLDKGGIKPTQKILQETPLVVEWRFDISGISKYAFNSKKGFEWWIEQFEEKLKYFDKAEEVTKNKDYTIQWREE